MDLKDYANLYLESGKSLTLVAKMGKNPILIDWVHRFPSKKEIMQHEGNLGWVLSKRDIVIDVDIRNGGEESLNQLCIDLDTSFVPTIKTPNGGFHVYLKKPSDLQIKKSHKKYPGIDFLSYGSQCLIAGSEINKGKYILNDSEFLQKDAPYNLLFCLELSGSEIKKTDENSNYKQSRKKVEELLNDFDPDCDYNQWIKIGMALHSWDSYEGLELWEKWSKEARFSYEVGETKAHWKSFGEKPNMITLGSLYYMKKDQELTDHQQKIESILHEINISDQKKIELDIIKTIKKQNFNEIDNERFVKTIQKRYFELTGVKQPISNIRKILKNDHSVNNDIPEWCKKYVYINSLSGFKNIDTGTLYKTEAFNLENNKYIQFDSGSKKLDARKYVADNGFVKVVANEAYLPEVKDRLTYYNNELVFNTFDFKSVPKEANKISEEGQKAIEFLKQHLIYLVGDDSVEHFIYWMAYQVQFPGKRLNYAPLIKSFEGMGKGMLGNAITGCLGEKNVGIVFPNTIMDKYTSWATNVSLNILNEIKISGHNRYDVLDKLKPFITDDSIDIRPMHARNYTTLNTCNYLAFTNYNLAVPLTKGDRRWWIIYCQIESKEELEKITGISNQEYFKRFNSIIKNHLSEVRKWLLDLEIPQSFLDIKRAPHTAHKDLMISTEESSHEGYEELEELLEEGGIGFGKECFCSSLFVDAVCKLPNATFDFNTSKRNFIFKRLGYSKFPRQIKWDGKPYRVWVKKTLTDDQIREYLNQTKKQIP